MTPEQMETAVLLALEEISSTNRTPTIGDIRHTVGNDDEAAEVAQWLTARGLIRRGQSLVGDYALTLEGKQAVQEIMDRRADRKWRRANCRQQVLAWLDNQGPVGTPANPNGFSGSLDGAPFTEDEADEAVNYLIDNGLATPYGRRLANGRWHLIMVSALGSDCVDSAQDIPPFLRHRSQALQPSQVFNMGGMGNTFATATADGATASATVTNTFNLDGGRLYAEMIRAAEEEIQLNDDAKAALADLETTDDPTVARRAATVLYQFLLGTAAGTAGQVLGIYGANLLGLTP